MILQHNELDGLERGCCQCELPLWLEDARLTLSTRGTVYYPKPTYNASIKAVYPGTSLAGENPLALNSTQLVNLVSGKFSRNQTNARHNSRPQCETNFSPQYHHQIASCFTMTSSVRGELLVRVLPPGAPEPADPPVLDPSLPGAIVTSDSTI